jgi:nucleoside-diphosphate-sugar epimerase
LHRQKIAIIGGSGHIGTHLVNRIASEPEFEPVIVVRHKLAERFFGDNRRYIRIGSITDNDSANRIVGDCDAIVNLAYAGKSSEALANNMRLVEAIASIGAAKTIINMSTVSVHASPFHTENMDFARPKPNSSYGESKLAMEAVISRALKKLMHIFSCCDSARLWCSANCVRYGI